MRWARCRNHHYLLLLPLLLLLWAWSGVCKAAATVFLLEEMGYAVVSFGRGGVRCCCCRSCCCCCCSGGVLLLLLLLLTL